jgi:hypothetical protein
MNDLLLNQNEMRTQIIKIILKSPMSYAHYSRMIGINRQALQKFIQGNDTTSFTLICKLNNFITQNADKIDENTK